MNLLVGPPNPNGKSKSRPGVPLTKTGVYGGRVFSEYHVGPLFAHGEYEMMSHTKKDDQTDQFNRIESPGLLFGVGTEYNISNIVKGNVMILYNFLHNNDSPYNKPFVFRFGFNLSK